MYFMFIFVLSQEDIDLIELLFAEQNVKLYNIALGILHNKDSAEEAVQEAYVKIIDNLQKINQIPCPERVPFCVVIVKNISLNMLRNQKRIVHYGDLSYVTDEDGQDIDQELLEFEDARQLMKLVNTLPERDKALVQMRWGEELSYRDIGELLGVTEEAAKKRGQRILGKLRKMYENKGDNNDCFL